MIKLDTYVAINTNSYTPVILRTKAPMITGLIFTAEPNSEQYNRLLRQMAAGDPVVKINNYGLFIVFNGCLGKPCQQDEARMYLNEIADYVELEILPKKPAAYRRFCEDESKVYAFKIIDEKIARRTRQRERYFRSLSDEYNEITGEGESFFQGLIAGYEYKRKEQLSQKEGSNESND